MSRNSSWPAGNPRHKAGHMNAPSCAGSKLVKTLADRAVPHMSQSQFCAPIDKSVRQRLGSELFIDDHRPAARPSTAKQPCSPSSSCPRPLDRKATSSPRVTNRRLFTGDAPDQKSITSRLKFCAEITSPRISQRPTVSEGSLGPHITDGDPVPAPDPSGRVRSSLGIDDVEP